MRLRRYRTPAIASSRRCVSTATRGFARRWPFVPRRPTIACAMAARTRADRELLADDQSTDIGETLAMALPKPADGEAPHSARALCGRQAAHPRSRGALQKNLASRAGQAVPGSVRERRVDALPHSERGRIVMMTIIMIGCSFAQPIIRYDHRSRFTHRSGWPGS